MEQTVTAVTRQTHGMTGDGPHSRRAAGAPSINAPEWKYDFSPSSKRLNCRDCYKQMQDKQGYQRGQKGLTKNKAGNVDTLMSTYH